MFNADKFVIPATNDEPELSNFVFNSCQDLASGWKSTQLGGGCKTTNFFCPYCMVCRKTMGDFKINNQRCQLCVTVGNERCFCHEVCDPDRLDKVEAELAEYVDAALDDGFRRIDGILSKSKMLFDSHIADKEHMAKHIDFVPKSKKEEKAHEKLVVQELKIRFPETIYKQRLSELLVLPADDQVDALKLLAKSESKILLSRSTVDRHLHKRDLAIALTVEKLVPCNLHMKLRVTEKIFTCLINFGLDRYGESQTDGKTRTLFALVVTACMRNKVFGCEDSGRQSQWKFNWCKGNHYVEKPNFDGSSANKLMQGIGKLATAVYSPELDEESKPSTNAETIRKMNEKKQKRWLELSKILGPLFKLIEQKEDYNDSEILELHKSCNTFMSLWMDLCGTSHMTNYIHIIGSGHLSYFGKKYGNLYRFSQQGWEGMNKLLKHFYFNNTNHGGSYGNGGKTAEGTYGCSTVSGDHCRPLMRMLQRSIMWTLGLGDAYFENKENERQRKTAIQPIETVPHTSTGTENNEEEESDLERDEFTFGIL
jgi:hypothetical protein